jgi:tetratricopeptide (TPR) repeat protein
MFKQIYTFFGPARAQAFVLLLGITGLLSLILNAVQGEETSWVTTAQSLLALIFLLGTVAIVFSRLEREARLRWAAILAPVVGALLLGLLVLPDLLLPLAGASVGWIIAGLLLFRPRIPRDLQQAVRHLRKGQYDEAIQAMNRLIKEQPENPDHYRFRAEIFRLWGKLDRARRDYEQMIRLAPDSAVAHNGLAEVYLQSGQYQEARTAGLRAYALAPDAWVAAYNLGMIEDRLGQSEQVVEHVTQALRQRIPDARHRLLMHLYLARAYERLGNADAAQEQIMLLRKERAGLKEWQDLMRHEQAAPLRAVLEADIEQARAVFDGQLERLG